MNEQQVIRFENLGKTFGRRKREVVALAGLDLAVNGGQVFGFLGPNGAGKTTTIRLLLGLIHPTTGGAYLFGENVHARPDIVRRVGSLVEGAAFYGFLTGRQNLDVLARSADDYNPRRRDELLEQVGLAEKADRRVKGYSTGMKQRLGLAAALLNDPDLIILDEPTNGLDPAGIQEMRTFIRALADDLGKTVFLSSHLLNEVEQVCDRVAIIHQGRMIKHGTVAELLSDGQAELRIQAQPVERAYEALTANWPVARDQDWLVVQAHAEESPHIVSRLVESQVRVYQVHARHKSLEALFMEVTGGDEVIPEPVVEVTHA